MNLHFTYLFTKANYTQTTICQKWRLNAMQVTIFSIITITALLILFKQTKLAYTLFMVTAILILIWFAHHSTDSLNINL